MICICETGVNEYDGYKKSLDIFSNLSDYNWIYVSEHWWCNLVLILSFEESSIQIEHEYKQ